MSGSAFNTSPTNYAAGGELAGTYPNPSLALSGLTAADPALNDDLVAYDTSAAGNRRESIEKVLGATRQAPGGRLTLSSGVPVTTSVSSASAIYYTPYIHDGIWLYDGTRWTYSQLPEIAVDITGFTSGFNWDVTIYVISVTPVSTDTGADTITFTTQGWYTGAVAYVTTTGGGLTAGTAYWVRHVSTNTVFSLHTTLAGALANTGKVNLTASISSDLKVYSLYPFAWVSDTARYSTPNYSITIADGCYYPTDASKQFRYLGTFRTVVSSGNTMDTPQRRLVYNFYNQVPRSLFQEDSTSSWTYSTNTWRVAGNNAQNFVDHVIGMVGNMVDISVRAMDSSTVFGAHYVGIAFDNGISPATVEFAAQSAGTYNQFNLQYTAHPAIGYHYYYWMEFGPGSGTTIWYGTSTSANGFRGFIMA